MSSILHNHVTDHNQALLKVCTGRIGLSVPYGQIDGAETGNIQGQNEFIAGLFGLAAQLHIDRFVLSCLPDIYRDYLQHNL